MVCVPCIVVPLLLWIFHKFIYPFIQKFWNPLGNKQIEGKAIEFTDGQLKTEEGQFVKEKIHGHPVVLFTKTTCSYCSIAKRTFQDLGVSYEEEVIDKREDMDKLQDLFLAITGARTVPRVFIGGKCIGGGSEVMSLNSQGKLESLVQEAGGTTKTKDT